MLCQFIQDGIVMTTLMNEVYNFGWFDKQKDKIQKSEQLRMSVNKILKKRKQQSGGQQDQNQYPDHQGTNGPQFVAQTPKMSQQQSKLEQQFQKYAEYSQSNPSAYEFSNTHLPYNASLNSRFRMPISIFAPPVSYDMEPVQRSIDKIPRCTGCRAYMNYYNEIKKRGFRCFVCGAQNMLGDYVVDAENIELSQPSYHVLGGENVYTRIPPQKAIAFLIDLNNTSYTSKALYYFVSAAKQVLLREDLNQTQIYFFTYDQVVHEYDFSGDEVKCTILDPSINISQGKTQEVFLQNIRDKLFALLDNLEEMAQHNHKQGSNFFKAFAYVTETIKDTAAKIFILQSNQAISGESFTNEYQKNPKQQTETKPKSFLQTRNKTVFSTFVDLYIKMSFSCAFFIFQKNYKNVRVLGDFAKVTNSQIFLYRKDSTEEMMKFYYDLSYVLGATYYQDVKMEFFISPGWYFTAVYGNIFRIREHITFKMCHLQPTKRVCVTFLPQENMQLPYCCMQVVTNYIYNRQHFVTVNTVVIPLTTSLDKLFTNQNYVQSAATLHRTFLSGVRIEEINHFRNKVIKQLALSWKAASDYYKKKISPEIQTFMLSQLALLKSSHFQLESINDSIVLDNIVAQRNFLQSCGMNELNNFFSPYLFNLTTMNEQMCRQDDSFIYPEVCELKFSSIKEGMYLMDNGMCMWLYISKTCDPFYLKALFGKDKFSKNEQLTEQNFLINSLFAEQVSNLIRVCREQKSYGWIPVFIVRCGENTLNEKLFYMNFYAEKYEEFRGFKMTFNQFIAYLGQQY